MNGAGTHRRLVGIIGLFKDPYHLLRAAREVQARKFVHCDAFTPYSIHGLDKLLNHKRSPVPWVTLVFGLMGCFGGLGMQIYVAAIDWPVNIGGKPFLSIPAFIPITFECTILVGGLATAAALFALCRLPNYHTRIFDEGITNNTFALYVPAKEKEFEEADVRKFLEKSGAYEIKLVE